MSSAFNCQTIKDNLVTDGTNGAEKAIDMPKAKGALLPAIIGIEVLHPKLLNSCTAKFSKWFLSTKSNGTTLPDEDDEEVIASGQKDSLTATSAVGQNILDMWERITLPAPIPVTKVQLYFQGKQDTGSAHTYRFRIYWVPRLVKGAVQQQSMEVSVQY